MKKHFLLLWLLVTIISCNKEWVNQEPDSKVTDESFRYNQEEIFEKYGCLPINSELILMLYFLEDPQEHCKYLFGSKRDTNNKEQFWISKFNSSGEYIWEIIDPKGDRAFYQNKLFSGDILFARVRMQDDRNVQGLDPVILSSENGKTTIVPVKQNYVFDTVNCFDDFFIINISQSQLDLYGGGKEQWYYQIDYKGKVLNDSPEMNLPSSDDYIWLSETEFVEVDFKTIKKIDLLTGEDWSFYAYHVPVEYEKCHISLSLEGETVVISYFITYEDYSQEKIECKIIISSGLEDILITDIELPEQKGLIIGEEITLLPVFTPENATVRKLHWNSSDPNVAIVDEYGVVKAINKGKCVITVSTEDASLQAHCQIFVTTPEDVNGIYFEDKELKIIRNQKYKLNPIVTPSTAVNKSVKWRSSAPYVVSVDQNGYITGIRRGEATIYAETVEGGFIASCTVTVADITDYIDHVFIPTSITMIGGYLTGGLYSQITNNSGEVVRITNLSIVDSWSNNIIAMADQSMLGNLYPGQDIALGYNNFYMVYYPIFVWEFMYEGEVYILNYRFGGSIYDSPELNLRQLKKRDGEMIILETIK